MLSTCLCIQKRNYISKQWQKNKWALHVWRHVEGTVYDQQSHSLYKFRGVSCIKKIHVIPQCLQTLSRNTTDTWCPGQDFH